MELGCLMSLLPSPGGFSQRAIVILNSTLWYLTSVLLFSSALALLASDISPKESSQCLPQGLCTCCHPHVESLSISHKTITSYRSLLSAALSQHHLSGFEVYLYTFTILLLGLEMFLVRTEMCEGREAKCINTQ